MGAFYDIKGVSYNQLIEHAKRVKPYRGSGGAYNLGYRKYSNRHYRIKDNGVIEIFFCYMENVRDKVKEGTSLYEGKRHLANIHPDNSFEIVHWSGQGDVQFLSAMMPYVTHSKAHHGLMIRSFSRWKSGDVNVSHPVFRGGRYDLESHEAVTPYILQPRAVNRKMRKEVIERYDTFKKVGFTMFEAMNAQGVFEIYKELWNEYGETGMHEIQPELITKLAHEGKYLDALLLSIICKSGFGWWGMWKLSQLITDDKTGNLNIHRLENFLGLEFKRSIKDVYVGSPEGNEGVDKLNDLLIKGTPDAFTYKDPIPNGHAFPASKWGYRLTDLSGNNLFRY
jgi:hypothetical protein